MFRRFHRLCGLRLVARALLGVWVGVLPGFAAGKRGLIWADGAELSFFDLIEALERAVELIAVQLFVTVQGGGRDGAVQSALKSEASAIGGGRGPFGFLNGHVAIDGALLNAPDAEQLPARDGEILDQRHFAGGDGLELVDVGVEKLAEAGFDFFREYDSARQEAVARAVGGGGGLAAGGCGAAGFGTVGSGGLGLFFGSHDYGVARSAVWGAGVGRGCY
jgi:hypothetical protein